MAAQLDDPLPSRGASSCGWLKAEVESFAAALEAVDADAAHWAAGDWLLEREPMGVSAWPRSGVLERLAELAEMLGRPLGLLAALRKTAHAWPAEMRPTCASWQLCRAFTLGGPERAAVRREQLEALPRGPRGRVTMPTLRAWRAAQAPAPPAPELSEPVDLDEDVAELCRRCTSLVDDADRLRRSGVVPHEVVEHLDGLMRHLAGLQQTLLASA